MLVRQNEEFQILKKAEPRPYIETVTPMPNDVTFVAWEDVVMVQIRDHNLYSPTYISTAIIKSSESRLFEDLKSDQITFKDLPRLDKFELAKKDHTFLWLCSGFCLLFITAAATGIIIWKF